MAYKISIVIPNYNGLKLLSQNLPQVVRTCPDCEIIVVDDASTDGSVNYLRKNFKKIKVLEHARNMGFAQSVNDGVSIANGQLIVLLNSDVSPRINFLKNAQSLFEKEQKIFAVGLADYSHQNGKVSKVGRGGALFKKGFVHHFARRPIYGETLWVSGGSGIFDKQKFLELGGFDVNFAPFYWEDIDLSFRAWLKGYICLFEPRLKVDHFHLKGAIKKSKSQFFIKTVSYRNQFLFVWKNIKDSLWLIQHLFWLPYHMIRAVVTFDLPFILGFLWAIFKIPRLVIDYPSYPASYPLTDREVLTRFAKQ